MGKREARHESSGASRALIGCAVGAAAGLAACLIVLAAAALLISSGSIGEERAVLCTGCACLVGGLAGGFVAVRQVGRRTLLVGMGCGVLLCAVLAAVGVVCFENVHLQGSSLWNCGAILLGGMCMGLLGTRSKKKRRK